MALQPVWEAHLYTNNQTSFAPGDGRTYAWMENSSPTTPFQPFTNVPARRFIQTDVVADTWYCKKEFFIPSSHTIQRLMRCWNYHVMGGYPGYQSSFATSAVALDVCPPGNDRGTNGVSGIQSHSVPFFEWHLWGGGTYDPAIDFFRNTVKRYFHFELAYNTWYFMEFDAKFMSNGTGFFNCRMNGVTWFSYVNASLNYPGVPGYGNTGGKTGFQLIEGGYEAAGSTANQREQRIQMTPARLGRSTVERDGDNVTVLLGDHSVGIGGAPSSVIFNTGLTIDDGSAGGAAPAFSVSPALTGDPAVGGTLTTDDGTTTGSPSPTFTYQWQLSADNSTWANIGGETADNYDPVVTDVGSFVRCQVTATNIHGDVTAPTPSTVAISSSAAAITTMGRTSPGAQTRTLTSNFIRANEFYLPVQCTLGDFTVRLGGTTNAGTQPVRCAIYESDGAGSIGDLVEVTASHTVSQNDPDADETLAPLTNPVLPIGYYALALHSGPPSISGVVAEAFFDGAPGKLIFGADTYSDGSADPYTTPSGTSPGDGLLTISVAVTPTQGPPGGGAPTRFYLPSSGAAAVTPVAFAGWDNTAFSSNLAAVEDTPSDTAMVETSPGGASILDQTTVLAKRYVTTNLPAQDLDSTVFVKGQVRVRESNAGMDTAPQLRIWVCSDDGSVNRGTLIDFASSLTNEFSTTRTNRKYPQGWTGSGQACSSVTLQTDDRLVIEIGGENFTALAAAWTMNFGFGDPSASSDLPEDESTTTDIRPWIEFSRDLFNPPQDPPVNTVAPFILGNDPPRSGDVMTCNPGSWDEEPSFTYQWRHDDGGGYDDITGATNQQYTVDQAVIGSTLMCVVTGTNAAGSDTADSDETAEVVSGAPVTITPPEITGSPFVGRTLDVVGGEYENTPTSFAYQWQREGSWNDIDGATGPSYTLTEDDGGTSVRCSVTAINSQGSVTDFTESMAISFPSGFPSFAFEVAFDSLPFDDEQNYTDLTVDVRSVELAYGRRTRQDHAEAGRSAVVLRNEHRNYDPENADGDYYPNVKPMRRMRMHAELDGLDYPVFQHYVDPDHGWPQAWVTTNYAETEVRGVDGFAILANIQLSEADSWAETLSGERVEALMDVAGVPADDRDIDEGQERLAAVAAGGLSGADLLSQLFSIGDTEAGLFLVAADGRFTWRDRHSRMKFPFDTPADVFADYPNIEDDRLPLHGLVTQPSDIRNRWQITRLGGDEIVAEDSDSIDEYTPRTSTLSTLHIDDDRVRSRISWEIDRSKDPRTQFERVVVKPGRNAALWRAVLGFVPGTRIRIVASPPGGGDPFDREVHIEGVSIRIPPNIIGAECEWRVSDAERFTYWIVGSETLSVLGTTTRVAH